MAGGEPARSGGGPPAGRRRWVEGLARSLRGTALLLAAGLGLPGFVTSALAQQMSIGDVQVVEGSPAGTTPANFSVTLSSPNPGPGDITAEWNTMDGTATAPGDYVAVVGGTVTFSPLEDSKTVTVDVVQNILPEPNRTFYVDLSNPVGATLLKRRGVGTILDDDATDPDVLGLVVVSDSDAGMGRNRLQWLNPVVAGTPGLRIRWNEMSGSACAPPGPLEYDGPSDGVIPDFPISGSNLSEVYEHMPLTFDRNYCYTVWLVYSGPAYSTGVTARGRPFDSTQAVKYRYFTGATNIVAPTVGLDAVVAVSNDMGVHALQRGSGVTAGLWPSPWSPVGLGSPAQNRPPVVTSDGVSRVFISTQDGRVHAIDVKSGAVIWSTLLTPNFAQAAPAGIFAAFGAAWDYILVGTSESANTNRFYALDPADGTIVDYFPKVPDDDPVVAREMGPINQMASVDYANGRVYFGLLKPTLHTLVCLQLGPPPNALQFAWGGTDGDFDEPITSPVLHNGRIYLGSNDDRVRSIPAADGDPLFAYDRGVGDGGVKSFVWPDRTTGYLYFATNNKVQALRDDGFSLVDDVWPGDVTVDAASIVLLWPGTNYLYAGTEDVGGNQGGLFQIDVTDADPDATKIALVLEDVKLVIGAPSLDIGHNLMHLGSEAGTIYAVQVPLP